VSIDNFLFSCKGQLSYLPKDFLQFAQTHQKYMSVQNQIKTIYNIFKDNYSLDDKAFKENCFVLETVKIRILICTYMPQQGLILRKAVSITYKLKFFRVKLSSVPEPQNKSYKIIFKKELAEVSDEVFLTMNGLQSKHKKHHIFDYRYIDNDPVTRSAARFGTKASKQAKKARIPLRIRYS
jgi:hypothetical protein